MGKIYGMSIILFFVSSNFGMEQKTADLEKMITLNFVQDASPESQQQITPITRTLPKKYAACSGYMKGRLQFLDEVPHDISDGITLDCNAPSYDSLALHMPEAYECMATDDVTQKRKNELLLMAMLQERSNYKLYEIVKLADYLDIEPIVDSGTSVIKNRLMSRKNLLGYLDHRAVQHAGEQSLPPLIQEAIRLQILDPVIIYLATKNGKKDMIDKEARSPIRTAAYGSARNLLALGSSYSSDVTMWQIENEQLTKKQVLNDHTTPVTAMTFHGDGQKFATGSRDYMVNIYQQGETKWDLKHTIYLPYGVASLAFNKNNRMAIGLDNATIELWKTEKDEKIWKQVQVLFGHKEIVKALLFSRDDATLLSGSGDRQIKVWRNVGGGVLLPSDTLNMFGWPQESVRSLSCSPDGLVLAAGLLNGLIKMYHQDKHACKTPSLCASSAPVNSLAFGCGGKVLASGSDRISLWYNDNGLFGHLRTFDKQNGNNKIISVSFTTDGSRLLTSSSNGMIKLWNTYLQTIERTLKQTTSMADALLLAAIVQKKINKCPHLNKKLKALYKDFDPDAKKCAEDLIDEKSCLICKKNQEML